MHRGGAGIAHERDDRTERVASDHAVVDQHDALALHGQRAELHPDQSFGVSTAWLDESAADEGGLSQSFAEGIPVEVA